MLANLIPTVANRTAPRTHTKNRAVSLAVSVQNLQCRRGAFELGPVSLDVAAGERLAIVGPSGSGKTTLLRCLAGLERPDAGEIRVGDEVVERVSGADAVHLPPARRNLGLVFQDGALWPQMTALQHLQFAAPGLRRNDAKALLERAGMLEQANKKPARMSGGEAQRLGLLRALAPSPQVLLLDEPLRSVDVHQRDGLVLLLRSMCEERQITSILVTHDRDEALALADRLIVMRDGSVVEQGTSIELLEQPRTAFTAAFLRGAACLPAMPDGPDQVRTAFGCHDAPTGGGGATSAQGELRLVVFPGEVETTSDAAGGPEARVLAVLPGEAPGELRVRVACGDQILIARAAARPEGPTTRIALRSEPRLLPWHSDMTTG